MSCLTVRMIKNSTRVQSDKPCSIKQMNVLELILLSANGLRLAIAVYS